MNAYTLSFLVRGHFYECLNCHLYLEDRLFNNYMTEAYEEGRTVARCTICGKVSRTKSNLRNRENMLSTNLKTQPTKSLKLSYFLISVADPILFSYWLQNLNSKIKLIKSNFSHFSFIYILKKHIFRYNKQHMCVNSTIRKEIVFFFK